MSDTILVVDNLSKKYGKKTVVDHVSFELYPGESIGLLGPNGAGKTTTFYMICGFIKPLEGRVLLNGEEITFLEMNQRAKKGIVYLPQESSIFKKLTVRDNLLAVLQSRTDISNKERTIITDGLLDELNLSYLADQYGFSLSGGERRRTEIARALSMEPKFLLLDEPFAAIDPKAVADIKSIIQRLVADKNIGILLTDHNERAALESTTRSHIIYAGKIIVSGSEEELVNSDLANKYYLDNSYQSKEFHHEKN